MRQVRQYRIREYEDERGSSPYRQWLDILDLVARARIQARVLRVESGNLGDHKPVGSGVMELRLDFGPGYRVYFGLDGADLVLLLVGGDKGSQRRDISRAQQFWLEYKKGSKDGTKK